MDSSTDIAQKIFKILEKFTIPVYDAKSKLEKVNKLRKVKFRSGERPKAMCSPSQDSLMEDYRRTAYRASQIWGRGRSLSPGEPIPSPGGWGWNSTNNRWEPASRNLVSSNRLEKCGCESQS